ncbi:homeobox protein HAT3.1-like protein isoform X1 [Tanacetum coccineum]|uniref:Homeobox protein HAT3.1-like protein isoform X1 n=1 Tax=Tanacetum coccineum TaxID=301880 RepID=A0ABQ5E7D0_9ASTR
MEKLRLEKELECAKSDINRYKLKIRDLFKQTDTSLEEGKFPEFLYDSDGLIDSEDLFCSTRTQIDVRLDNDIILCDGACDRGFHQFCLDQPLLKEQGLTTVYDVRQQQEVFERPTIVEEMLKDLQSDLKYTSPTLIAVEADQVENLTRKLEDQAGGFVGKSSVEGGLDPILTYTAGAEIE